MTPVKKEMKGLALMKSRLARKSALVTAFLNSAAGKEMIKVLEEEFYDGEIKGSDPYDTYYNLGRRDVVAYLKQLAKWRESTEIEFL